MSDLAEPADGLADGLVEVLAGPVLQAAPRLLGSVLTLNGVSLRLTEVEAYGGPEDPGSHAHRGMTPRNATMFGPPGHLYCYLIYGMHTCANVVCGPTGTASAVLLRAGEVLDGHDLARVRRGRVADVQLARGPANLAKAVGLSTADDGLNLVGALHLSAGPSTRTIRQGPRVGLRRAPAWPWRIWLEGEPTVSSYRAAKGNAAS